MVATFVIVCAHGAVVLCRFVSSGSRGYLVNIAFSTALDIVGVSFLGEALFGTMGPAFVH